MFPDLAEPDRDVDQGMRVAPAGFQHQRANRWIGGEPVREHAARRAGADDDVVVFATLSHRYLIA
jgi:hypothetical protein